jgi:hypothetical protein
MIASILYSSIVFVPNLSPDSAAVLTNTLIVDAGHGGLLSLSEAAMKSRYSEAVIVTYWSVARSLLYAKSVPSKNKKSQKG